MLIRPQAIAAQRLRHFGSTRPIVNSSALLGGAVLLALLAFGVYLAATSNYRERITVTGYLAPTGGISRVTAPRSGRIEAVFVAPGAEVRAGEPLLKIVSGISLEDGRDFASALSDQYRRHAEALQTERRIAVRTHDTERTAVTADIAALTAELEIVADQRVSQQRWLAIASQRFNRMRAANVQGAASTNDVLRMEGDLLAGDVQLKALQRAHIDVDRRLRAMQRRTQRLSLDLATRLSTIEQAEIELVMRRLETDRNRAQVIVAPMHGRIVSLAARRATEVSPGRELLVLAPADAPLRAELFAPAHTMGLIRPGQPIALRYDAFPYQEFGVFPATVESVADYVLDRRDLDVDAPIHGPIFRVVARPQQQQSAAHDERVVLQAGMTLSADIGIRKLSVLHWLFEPLLRAWYGPLTR
jgi:membrane fusion protein